MKQTVCDLCGERATITWEIYKRKSGHRPLLGLHENMPRAAGKMFDLCDGHSVWISALFDGGPDPDGYRMGDGGTILPTSR